MLHVLIVLFGGGEWDMEYTKNVKAGIEKQQSLGYIYITDGLVPKIRPRIYGVKSNIAYKLGTQDTRTQVYENVCLQNNHTTNYHK